MKDLLSFVAFATAVVTLCSTYITYRVATRTARDARARGLFLARLSDPSVRTVRWNIRRYRRIMVWIGLAYLACIATFLRQAYVIAGAAIGVVAGSLPLFLLRTEPPSRVRKIAELDLRTNSIDAYDRCIRALGSIGARIASANAESEPKVVVARTRLTWRSWGDILTVSVSSVEPDVAHVHVESDSVSPAMVLDFGSNARNIRRFTGELLGLE